VPPAQLGKYLRVITALMGEYGYRSPLYGHYGQGCVHTRINFDFRSEEGVRKFREFITRAADVVIGVVAIVVKVGVLAAVLALGEAAHRDSISEISLAVVGNVHAGDLPKHVAVRGNVLPHDRLRVDDGGRCGARLDLGR